MLGGTRRSRRRRGSAFPRARKFRSRSAKNRARARSRAGEKTERSRNSRSRAHREKNCAEHAACVCGRRFRAAIREFRRSVRGTCGNCRSRRNHRAVRARFPRIRRAFRHGGRSARERSRSVAHARRRKFSRRVHAIRSRIGCADFFSPRRNFFGKNGRSRRGFRCGFRGFRRARRRLSRRRRKFFPASNFFNLICPKKNESRISSANRHRF